MACRVIECQQYDDTWWNARRGVPTASEFGNILTPKTMKLSASADKYINHLIGDIFDPSYPRLDIPQSRSMARGSYQEVESRHWYALEAECDVKEVGFILDASGQFGCSPDGLIGDNGTLELKNPDYATQVAYVREGVLPAEYKCQVHGQLIVTEREWCDFLSYCPKLPPLLIRVYRDDFTTVLKAALWPFWEQYQEALAFIRGKLAA